ncbi:MAG TPA: CPBP family intramembrane metalloprotease [candidate division Zixibacteria bacterium]|nr:CPBP family intramembrane metalloprotease [candidate division Zixibacteria bacterium]
MNTTDRTQPESASEYEISSLAFFVDLALYLSVMFLIREVYFPSFGFLANGLFWSLTTLGVATWRMRARGVTWVELGLCKPKLIKRVVLATVSILVMAIASIVIFGMLKDWLSLDLSPDTSNESAVSKFGDLKDNWGLFFTIIPFIWLESFLEEVLDRGFLMNWIERMFSSTLVATILAVILQAAIFGFRHSNDLSERSITVGLIGIAMGVGYVVFGRNLWPLILAHCALNTMSMLDRVG